MFRLTDTVKHLIIINVLIYFGVEGLKAAYINLPNMGIFFPTSEAFKPYQIVTHMFMHGSTSHLFFNMLLLFFMGPMMEDRLGKQNFLILYLTAGLFSTFFAWVISYLGFQIGILPLNPLYAYSVGASGAIFGIIGAFGFLFSEMKVRLLIPPIPIQGKYLALLLLVFGMIMDVEGNVGHWSHLGGAMIGVLLIKYWGKKGEI